MSKSNTILVQASKAGYRVKRNGSVAGPSGKPLVLYPYSHRRYLAFSARTEAVGFQSRPIPVHRLAAYQKYGDLLFSEGLEVRHLNGDRNDNRLSNIAIGTASDNQYDIPRGVRLARGRHAASKTRKLTSKQLIRFRKDRASGMTYRELREKYGLAKSTVSYIVNGKTY